jgi:hypothetical protein
MPEIFEGPGRNHPALSAAEVLNIKHIAPACVLLEEAPVGLDREDPISRRPSWSSPSFIS